MMNWLWEHTFGHFIHNLLVWSPWLWLSLCVAGSLWCVLTNMVLWKSVWKTVLVVALIGFVVLWVWQHFAGIQDLTKKNEELQGQLDTANSQVQSLNRSISGYNAGVHRIEERQREITTELAQAKVGLDSTTILKEAHDDPVKASTDLSDRWNNLGRMSNDETASFGRATPSATGTGSNQPSAGAVGGPQGGRNR